MKSISCGNKIYDADPIVSTSKTLLNAILDTGDDCIPTIPDCYDEALNIHIHPFIDVLTRLRSLSFLTEEIYFDMSSAESLRAELTLILADRIKLLELYNFLDVDENHLNVLAKEIGIILDESNIIVDLIPDLEYIICKNYPSAKCSNDQVFKNASISRLSKYLLEDKFFECCLNGNLKVIKYMLYSLPDSFLKQKFINSSSKYGELKINRTFTEAESKSGYFFEKQRSTWDCAFLNACASHNVDLVKFLLDKVKLKKIGKFGILTASFYKRWIIVKFLVENGVDPNHNNYMAWAPIIVACKEEECDMVKFLLDNNSVNYHQEALKYACLMNNQDIIELLIARGRNINISQALVDIAGDGNPNTIKYLTLKGADVDYKNGQSLIKTIKEPNVANFKALIKNGASTKINSEAELTNIILSGDKQRLRDYQWDKDDYAYLNKYNRMSIYIAMIEYIQKYQRPVVSET